LINAKLHYTDTGYGHVVQHHPPTDGDVAQHVCSRCPCSGVWAQYHQRTSTQQFYNLLYSKFTTNGQKFAISQHLHMSWCWALALRCGKFVVQTVVELLWACPLCVYCSAAVTLIRKFAIKRSLKIVSHLKRVASRNTIFEILMSEN